MREFQWPTLWAAFIIRHPMPGVMVRFSGARRRTLGRLRTRSIVAVVTNS